MKRIAFIALFFFLNIFSLQGNSVEHITPKVVAFDLHGVVLHYDWKAILPRMWSFSQKWQLVKNLWYLPVCALVKTMCNNPSFEQVLQLVGKQNLALRELLVDLSVQQRIDEKVAALIWRLHQNPTCKIHVVSNIGQESYQRLCDRFHDTFSCFSAVTTSNMFDENNKLIKKPDPAFFKQYLKEQHLQPEEVLFVDDRKKNIEVAQGLGMQTIHFTSAQQLQRELEARNLIAT